MSLTHTHTNTHSFTPMLQYLSPHQMTNCLATSCWPACGSEITTRPADIKMTHPSLQSRARASTHNIPHTRTHTHITFVRMKSLCVGWRGRDKGKNLEQLNKKKRKMGSRWWKELRLSLGPALSSNSFFHLSVTVCCEGPFRQTVFLTEDFVHFDNP